MLKKIARLLTGSILNKLFAITGLGTVLVVAAALFGILQAWQSLQGFEHLMGEEVDLASRIEHLKLEYAHQESLWQSVLVRGDDNIDREKYLEALAQQRRDVVEEAGELLGSVSDPVVRDSLQAFVQRHGEMEQLYREAFETYELLGYNARMADDMTRASALELEELLNEASRILQAQAQAKTRSNIEEAGAVMVQSFVAMGIAIVVAFVVFLLLLRRSILKPTHALVEDLERLAEGDFSVPIKATTRDEIGKVAVSARQLQERLGHALGQIADAVAQVASSAEELAVVSEQTTQGVSQQRGETAQVAAAMNQMSATVQEVARHAALAAESTQEADHKALHGRQVVERTTDAINALAANVEQAVTAIRRLDEDSVAIGAVLDVIRGVAEQTNLLALNAAIEAARAGEQGRGFAVVADEVRTLALRTQKSTEEIQDMVERVQAGSADAVKVMDTSRSKAEQAVGEARGAAESLRAITDAVGTIKDMNNQIASAAEEQSATAEEMNRNITTISQISEQNADGAAQTTAAGEELARLAADLQSLVGQFRLAGKR